MLGGGLAGSTVLDRKGASMLAGKFQPGFRIDLHHKDMGIIIDAARAKGVVIPLGAAVRPADRLAARAEAMADWTTRPCCAASNELSGQPNVSEGSEHQMRTDDSRGRRREDLGAGRRHPGLRPARCGDQPVLRGDAPARRDRAHARPPRRGRLAHGRGLHPGQGGQHRRLHRHVRARPAPT